MSAMRSLTVETLEGHEDLRADLREIEARLEEGYRMIDAALAEGRDVARWERHWLRLLDDYERIYDALVA